MSFRRRKYTKRSRRLSKSYILTNRSAKAQSRQIASLNRKVNILTKQNRPEIMTRWVALTRTFTNSSLASNYDIYYWNPWSTLYTGTGDFATIDGNFARNKGISVKFNIEYSDSWSGNVASSENHQRTASYRVLIAQVRDSNIGALNTTDLFNRIFNVSSTLSSADANIIQPLKSGVSSYLKILYSKSFGISNQHPIRIHNINLKRGIINYGLERSGDNVINPNYTRGTVIVAILTGGLHSDADYNSQIVFNTVIKLAFTDN